MAKFDFNGFVRECYLRSNPSVDLNGVTSENTVKCSDHRLSTEEYDAILQEYGVTDKDGKETKLWGDGILLGCNMWMLQSGPQLYNAKAS